MLYYKETCFIEFKNNSDTGIDKTGTCMGSSKDI
jgi:hypothetical protein